MKKIVLLLLFSIFTNLSFGQGYQIQIILVDSEIGYPTDYYNNTAISNDLGLNAIFNNYNATFYYPGNHIYPDYTNRTHFVLCSACNENEFETALNNYTSVVEKARKSVPGFAADQLYVKLIDINNGSPTGETTSEGYIITNNNELNEIFIDYKVYHYEQMILSTSFFELACDCYGNDLVPILEAQSESIELAELAEGYAILGVDDNTSLDFKFYPNPATNYVSVETTSSIEIYELFNTLGQRLIQSNNLDHFNLQLSSIASGLYLFKITTIDGTSQTVRLLKN